MIPAPPYQSPVYNCRRITRGIGMAFPRLRRMQSRVWWKSARSGTCQLLLRSLARVRRGLLLKLPTYHTRTGITQGARISHFAMSQCWPFGTDFLSYHMTTDSDFGLLIPTLTPCLYEWLPYQKVFLYCQYYECFYCCQVRWPLGKVRKRTNRISQANVIACAYIVVAYQGVYTHCQSNELQSNI